MPPTDDFVVCISAVGAVTPLGDTVDDIAKSFYESKSGIKEIKKFDVTSFLTKWAGVPEFGNSFVHWPRVAGTALRRPGELLYAERAMDRLVSEVDPITLYKPEQIGCVLGVDEPAVDVQRCIEFLQNSDTRIDDRAALIRQASEFFRVSEFLDSETTSVLRVVHKRVAFTGYTRCHVGLCSASLQAIGMGLRAIRTGRVDAVIAGGVSAKITPINIARLEAIGAVCVDSKLGGSERSRPFDGRRSGFVPAEGAVLFLLERECEVRKRGGKNYCRIKGYGSSMGAQHIIAPHLDEMEMRLCMNRALHDANVAPNDIDCVNAHGTSTKLNDQHEARALTDLFCGAGDAIVTATKSLHGHLIAAAGAMEVLSAAISFERDFIPAIRNLDTPEPAMGLPLATNLVNRRVRRILKNSFGMGGLAASMVLENPRVAAS